jgi:hypothetical protein
MVREVLERETSEKLLLSLARDKTPKISGTPSTKVLENPQMSGTSSTKVLENPQMNGTKALEKLDGCSPSASSWGP